MNVVATNRERLSDTALKAVVIYDDSRFGSRAVALLERLAIRVGNEIRWDVKSWGLDVVRQPTLAAVTLAVAADADLILLAFGEIHAPPPKLLDWLERWSAERQIPDAAVTLLCPEEGAARPLQSEVEKFTQLHGLAFLGGHQAWNVEMSAPGVQGRLHRMHRKQSTAPDTWAVPELEPATSHWD